MRLIGLYPGPEGEQYTGDNRHIGEVEDRPPAEIDEVDHVPSSKNIEKVSRCTAQRATHACQCGPASKKHASAVQPEGCKRRGRPDDDQRHAKSVTVVEALAMVNFANLNQPPAQRHAHSRLHRTLSDLVE